MIIWNIFELQIIILEWFQKDRFTIYSHRKQLFYIVMIDNPTLVVSTFTGCLFVWTQWEWIEYVGRGGSWGYEQLIDGRVSLIIVLWWKEHVDHICTANDSPYSCIIILAVRGQYAWAKQINKCSMMLKTVQNKCKVRMTLTLLFSLRQM